ncbi:MAG TPA: hypothetical protein PK103_08010, partial [Elusimicrobiales bacterium]|nr:hypothetical protein [Elusimicrobiales bacterium]
KVAVSTGALAPTTTSMWYFADLPDMQNIDNQWVELTGFKRYLNLTNGQISLNMGLTQEPTMYIDSSLRDSFYFRYLTSSTIVPGFSTGSLKSVNITTVNDPIHFLGGEVVITYEAINNSVYKVDTVRQFVGQTALGTSASVFNSRIFLNEEDIIPIEIYAKINGSNDSRTSTNQFSITASLGGVASPSVNYISYYTSALISDWKFIYSFTSALSGFSNGAVITSTISANGSAGGYGMELFITYKYKNNAAHTSFYGSYAGNNAAISTSYSYNNIPLVWLESGSSKTVNSGYVLGDIIAANLNGDQQTSIAFNSNSPFTMTHRTINESPTMFQLYQNLSQINTSTNSFNVNYQNVSGINSVFNGSAWINYLYTPPPKLPYNLAQKRADNNYEIPVSSWINTGSVNFYATVSSSKTYDNLALSIELKPNSSLFDGLNLTTSSFSAFNANTSTYNLVYVSSSGLISGTVYKWRIRAVGDGGAGQWVDYFSPSFGVDLSSPTPPPMLLITPIDRSSFNYAGVSFSFDSGSDTGGSEIKNYELQVSTKTDFSVISFSSMPFSTSAFANLAQNKYYWRVRAYDNAGNIGVWSSTRSFIVDLTQPNILNSQSGDDIWRSTNTGVYYNVGFDDNLSYLNKFQIKVTTGPEQSGTLITDWTDIATNINQSSYGSWNIPNNIFDLMQNGTNYVSVKVYDNAGNVNVSSDVFYVLKDTISPTVPNLTTPVSGSSTNITNVNFNWNFSSDSLSGVNGYEIEISTLSDFSVRYSSGYATGLSTNFVLGGGYRYYWKVRAKDNAGNFGDYSSVFSIVVDTIPPVINDNQLGDDIWRSTNTGVYYNVGF